MNNETMVLVSLETYQRHIEAETALKTIAKMALETASLNYKKTELIFSDTVLGSVLKTFYPAEYAAKIAELQKAEAEEE